MSKRVKENIIIAVCCALPSVLIGLAIAWEIAVWRECLADHSWWYCLRVTG